MKRIPILALALAACSTTAGVPLSESATHDDDGASTYDDEDGDDGQGDDRGEETGGGPGDDSGVPPDVGDGTDGAVDPEPGIHPECPRPLPPEWVFCADFEDAADPSETFFEYEDADGAFVPVEGGAASGLRSMEATYHEGVESAGWLSVAFGRNPIVFGAAPQYADGTDFAEIYWRLRVKMEAGWPDVGPHHLSRVSAFAAEDWLQAMTARLRSDGDGVLLVADPSSCVNGDQVACSAYEDVDVEKSLGALAGAFPLFSAAESGEWHCIEAHVRLNTPSVPDGVLEFWIDGELQNQSTELDWRGSWAGYGLNLVTIDNRWTGGAPKELRRRVDDLVIATQPIGCE
ncbi:MAG TPA: hypothetical protein VFG69_07685 [Nannocystaceae bacterium]|nr:hypothetical protein [Nannocystaceae bacterium]